MVYLVLGTNRELLKRLLYSLQGNTRGILSKGKRKLVEKCTEEKQRQLFFR